MHNFIDFKDNSCINLSEDLSDLELFNMEENFSINEFIEGDTKYKTNIQMLPKEIINEKEIKTECNIIPFSGNIIGGFPDFEFKEDIEQEQEQEKEIKVIEIENKKEDEIKPEISLNKKNDEFYPIEKIIKTFNENKDLKQFAKYVEDKGRIKENIRKKIENITTKRERSTKEQMNIKREINERNKEMNKNKKLGRKLKKDYSDRAHNKFLDDNILKKIKSKFLHYLILFVNAVIKGENISNKKEFKFLNYSYTDSLKKSEEIKLLNMTIKEIIMNKSISPKYSKPVKIIIKIYLD